MKPRIAIFHNRQNNAEDGKDPLEIWIAGDLRIKIFWVNGPPWFSVERVGSTK